MPDASEAGMPSSGPLPNRLTSARLDELRRLLILDSGPRTICDDIVRLLARTFDAPIAIGQPARPGPRLVHRERRVGANAVPDIDELLRGVLQLAGRHHHCRKHHARRPVLEPSAGHGPAHIRFYASARLVLNGHTVGTLCCHDFAPKNLAAEQRELLRVLAQAAMTLLAERIAALPERPSAA